jgi:signal transduction histidine kinase
MDCPSVQRAVRDERQRIMRELHDGVGSQLVGLLSLVGRLDADPAVLESHVKQALDEMRMVVDSLQPLQGDLVTVLAMLRYRLQPRLQAAGLVVRWDVSPLQSMPEISPQVALQVQRIVLEAVTNVMRHARADAIELQARPVDRGELELTLADNGVGPPQDGCGGAGQGLANMRARAAAIGGHVALGRGEQGGTRVVLRWPMDPCPVDAAGAAAGPHPGPLKEEGPRRRPFVTGESGLTSNPPPPAVRPPCRYVPTRTRAPRARSGHRPRSSRRWGAASPASG